MEILTNGGSWEIHPASTQRDQDKYSSKGEKDGKDNYGCKQCPYNVKSATKAAIKRHITIKHATKVSNSPTTRNGMERQHGETNDGGKNTEKIAPKLAKSRIKGAITKRNSVTA